MNIKLFSRIIERVEVFFETNTEQKFNSNILSEIKIKIQVFGYRCVYMYITSMLHICFEEKIKFFLENNRFSLEKKYFRLS